MKNETSIPNSGSFVPKGTPLMNCSQVFHCPANDEPGEEREQAHADDEDQLTVRVERHPITVGAAAAAEHAGPNIGRIRKASSMLPPAMPTMTSAPTRNSTISVSTTPEKTAV